MNQQPQQRCGSIAIVGQPNAGKSTLVNAMIGAKIIGISRRPETTRQQIIGICTTNHAQLIFMDTPGLLTGTQTTAISQSTQQHATRTASEADLLIYLFDCTKLALAHQTELLHTVIHHKRPTTPILFALSKTDRLKRPVVWAQAQQVATWIHQQPMPQVTTHQYDQAPSTPLPTSALLKFAAESTTTPIFGLSAKNKHCVSAFKHQLISYLPQRSFLFPANILTNCSDEFIAAEMIREQIFRKTADEIPYQTYVTTTIKTQSRPQPTTIIHGTIHVAKKSHKGMIIGKQGQTLRRIREDTEPTLKQYFTGRIVLRLWVKVVANWHKNPRQVNEIMSQRFITPSQDLA